MILVNDRAVEKAREDAGVATSVATVLPNVRCRDVRYHNLKLLPMSKMMTTAEIVKDNEEAMKRAAGRAKRSKAAARAFLVRAGILDKTGKRLAKPYR
jgi:hypothetical protein